MKKRKAMFYETESTRLPSGLDNNELHQLSSEQPTDQPALPNGITSTYGDTESARLLPDPADETSSESEAPQANSPKSPKAKFRRSVSWPDWSENPGKLVCSYSRVSISM